MRYRIFAIMTLAIFFSAVSVTPYAIAVPATHTVSFDSFAPGWKTLHNAAPGELLVKLRTPYGKNSINSTNKKMQAHATDVIGRLGVQIVKIPKAISMSSAIEEYSKLPSVEYAEPNYMCHALGIPNDSFYNQQWSLPKIGVPQLWESFNGASAPEVIVAVIDTGVDYNHPDLEGKVIKGRDFANNDADPMDDCGHGTHIAGTIAAILNNNLGVAGIAPSAKILAIKALDGEGIAYDSTVAEAITYAADQGAEIINLSLGGEEYSKTVEDSIVYARQKGCLVIASAGNDATDVPYYPASYPLVLSVSATDANDALAEFSNYGQYIDIAAPGVDIVSTLFDTNEGSCFASMTGTSMAAGAISGVAALIAAKYPNYTMDQISRIVLRSTTDLGDVGRDDRFGYGRIDASKAISQNFVTYEESATGILVSGAWRSYRDNDASGDAYVLGEEPDATLTFSFTGDSIYWISGKGMNAGSADVYIDGTRQATVDLYSEDKQLQETVFSKTWPAAGQHTIKIVTIDGGVCVDAFDIGNGSIVSVIPAPTNVRAVKKANSIVVSWAASISPDLKSYAVYRSVNNANSYKKIAMIPYAANSFTDKGVKTGIKYFYRVSAIDASGMESPGSNAVSIIIGGPKRAKRMR
ncbi:MAG TPA: S8 family serine peptidase [Candidatus Aquicultor sp.]|jgi:thermitase